MWDAVSVALLKKLWASAQSAAQIATRLGRSRDAVCAKLLRMGLKRGHKPPTAKPKIGTSPGAPKGNKNPSSMVGTPLRQSPCGACLLISEDESVGDNA